MSNVFKLSRESLQKIDWLLPRLKFSVLPSKIVRWLENFEEVDHDNAMDLLQMFEYISFDELMTIFNDYLKEILKRIPVEDKIIIFPYGKVGKSGSLITYPLSHTPAYKKRKDNILLTHDYKNISNPEEYKHIIFIDDFVGSGNTFYKEFRTEASIEAWVNTNGISNIYLLCSVIMEEGKKFLKANFQNLEVYAEVRNKIFDPVFSPLNIIDKLSTIRKMNYKYGGKIRLNRYPPYYLPYGYDNSESLISFFHCTPNNTLPIFWAKDTSWEPLFPRKAEIRMKDARLFKKDIAFMIGICNRLGIDLYKNESILIKKGGVVKREIKYNSKLHHSIVAMIKLKRSGIEDLVICHILGLTMQDLRSVYSESFKMGLTSPTRKLTYVSEIFLKQLYDKTRSEKFRKETDNNLEIKNTLYLPKQFRGLA